MSCRAERLTELDLDGCLVLTYLDCSSNQLTSLNVSGCSALTYLNCSYNQLTSLNVSGCSALTTLYCSNTQLTSLNVSGYSALTTLICNNTQLTTLNASGCSALTELVCDDTPLTSLNVSSCSALTTLLCRNTPLTSLDVSGCSALTGLHFYGNSNTLTELNVSSCSALTTLYCSNYKLTSLNVSGCSALTDLRCSDNQLTELDVSSCPALTTLYCWNNQLTELNISGCSALTELQCYGNQLTELDVSSCSALTELYCWNNQLTELDIRGCSALTILQCNANQLTKLNISGCTALTGLECGDNKLTSLNVSGCSALTLLKCYDNKLEELDLNECTALTHLNCFNNQLTELDVSDCTALEYLQCASNQLTELDLSKNKALRFDIYDEHTRNGHLWQKARGLKTKKTSKGNYEINMKDYVSRLEYIEYADVDYNKGTGIATVSYPVASINYGYNTGLVISGKNIIMPVKVTNALSIVALERSGFGTGGLIIGDMTDNSYLDGNGNTLTESQMRDYRYSDYGKLGLAADGNSRLILRAETDKPGTASFSFKDNIDAKLESLATRKELSASDQLSTTQFSSWLEETHQVSAVLVAPERFPESKLNNFPSDTFKVHVKFTDEDGEITEDDLELKLEAAPVVLMPGMFDDADNAYKTFGIGASVNSDTGIYRELKLFGFDETHIHVWNDYDRSKGPNELLAYINNGLFKKITEAFNQYASGGIVCTKADIVAHGMGGLMARRFLHESGKDSQDGNNWSVRSYKQGMVRRLITIATPHYGTPWADSINKRRSITMMYNGILNTPYFDEHPFITSVADRIFLMRMCNLMVNTLIPSPQLTKNSHIFLGSAWEEMKTTSPRSYGLPAGVPMYAIYGNIIIDGVYRDSMTLFSKLVDEILKIDVDVYDLPSTGLSYIEKKLTGSMKNSVALMVFSFLRDIPDYARIGLDAFSRGLFGSEANDLIVSASSASGGLRSSEYVNTALDVMDPNPFDDKRDRYSHWSICKQLDVGEKVALLLKGAKNEFTVFDSEVYETANRVQRNLSDTLADDIDETEEFVFAERLNFNVEPSVLNVSNPQNVKFSVTADMSLQNDVYCIFGNDSGYRFFKMPPSDKSGRKFEVEFNAEDIFASMDKGAIEILCMSCISDDSGISGMYTSNTAHIASLTGLDSINITGLDFLGASTIYTSINSETPAGLFAVDSDGRYYDVSSPLVGTEWTSTEFARVNENGCIYGLKKVVRH